MKIPVLGTILAVLLCSTIAPPAIGEDPSWREEIGWPDPVGTWRTVTQTSATSDCIGNPRTPACALDTLAACIARRDAVLCDIGTVRGYHIWKDHFLDLSPSGQRDLQYRIVAIKELDEDSLNWQEKTDGELTAGDAQSIGDIRIVAAYRECLPASGAAPSCGPVFHLILWAWPDHIGWQILDWIDVDESALNATHDDFSTDHVTAMKAAAAAAAANKTPAEIRALAPSVLPRLRVAPFMKEGLRPQDPAVAALATADPPGTWRELPRTIVPDDCFVDRTRPLCVVYTYRVCRQWLKESDCRDIDYATLALAPSLPWSGDGWLGRPYRVSAVNGPRTAQPPPASGLGGDDSRSGPDQLHITIESRCELRGRTVCSEHPLTVFQLRRHGERWRVEQQFSSFYRHHDKLTRDGLVEFRFRPPSKQELDSTIAPTDIVQPDPANTWRRNTASSCIGSVASVSCALDTLLACQYSHDPALCDLVDEDPARPTNQRNVPSGAYEEYRIESAHVLKPGLLTSFEYYTRLLRGDVRVHVQFRRCEAGRGPHCSKHPSTIYWLRWFDNRWNIERYREVDEVYLAAAVIYQQD